jgi:predicted amidohydrolase
MPEAFTDVIMRARAMENKVCMVSTAYLLAGGPDFRAPKIHGRSCVIDPAGVIVAEVGNRIGVATATVEFDDSAKQTGPSSAPFEHRLPGTYRELTGRR